MATIKRHQVSTLASVHSKLNLIDFDSPKEAIQHVRDGKKIDVILDENQKILENIRKKYDLKEGVSSEVQRKANEEYVKLILEDAELDIEPYKEVYISKLKLTPVEALVLEESGLYKFE